MSSTGYFDSLSQFHFLRPEGLWLLLPLFLCCLLLARRGNSGDWHAVVDRELLPHLLQGQADSSALRGIILFALAGLLAILALAGPAWRELPQPVFRNQNGLVLALDLSRSMQATDLKPDRVGRARFKISDILEQSGDGQVALLVYAGSAFTVTPLTDDRATLELQLPALNTELMPAQGSSPAAALELAQALLKQAGLVSGQIWLLTDGLPADSDLNQLVKTAEGYPISVLGVGTPDGAPIPTGSGFLKDRNGNIVIPKLDETPLRQLAARSGGRYARLSRDDGDINHLLAGLQAATAGESEEPDRRADQWQEEGPWLLIPLLFIAASAFRRGLLTLVMPILLPLLIVSTTLPTRAVAEPSTDLEMQDAAAPGGNAAINPSQLWKKLWKNPNQRGQEAFERGDNAAASAQFTDPQWQAAARYRQQDYAGALEALEGREDLHSTYNRGNARAQLGDYQGALAEYERVLEQQPDHEDARYNRELVEQKLKEQQDQSSDQQQGNDSEQSDSESAESSSQNDASEQSDQGSPKENDGESENSDEQNDSEENDSGQEDSGQNSADQSAENDGSSDSTQDQNRESSEQSEQPEQQQAENQPQQAEAQPQESDPNADPEGTLPQAAEQKYDLENQQATEQWLRRIPDDPGGLLRRKFQYQYQRQGRPADSQGDSW